MSHSEPDANSEYYAQTRAELRGYLPELYTRVLEVGCGRGGFRANLAASAEVWGVEPFADAAKIASGYLTRVLVGKYEDVQSQLPDAAFDLIICNDVIEHMADDAGFLQAIRQKMQPGGYLMGSVPNMRNLPVLQALVFNKDWEYQDAGVLDRTHLRFYTDKSLGILLARAGFDVTKFGGINRHVGSPNWIMRCLLKTRYLEDTQWTQFAFLAKLSNG
jgi:2-polyprenyl-3-methyl-5-hydroxy-6-metoxy-1,4-benzoquinol methylase